MPFQDSVTGALTNGNTPAPTPTPDIQAQTGPPNAEVSSSAPPPAATPASTPQPAATRPATAAPSAPIQEDSKPGSFFHHLSRAFSGAVLGGLAGGHQTVDHYETDDSGKMKAVMRPLHPSERLELLARSALQGLAAGSAVPPQKSKMAALAAGIGSGAEAQLRDAQGQDLLKRQQAQQDFERQQQALVHRATIAQNNASVYRDYVDSMNKQWDRDPEYANGQAIREALDEYNSETSDAAAKNEYQVLTPEQAQALFLPTSVGGTAHTPDAHPLAKQVIVGTLRPVPATDSNGNPLMNDDGTPKMRGQVLVMSGNGKMKLPKAYVDDLQKYKELIGGAKNFKEGDEVTPLQFARLNTLRLQAKQKVQAGWDKPEKLRRADGTDVLVNPVSGEVRDFPTSPGGSPAINVQAIQNELNKGVAGERAAEIAAGLQNVIDDPANAAIKPTLQKLQAQANTQAQASTKYATGKAGAVAGAEAEVKQRYEVNKPVYAYNTQSKQLEQTTKGDVAANPTLYTHPVDVKESDIRKDTELARQLGDAQLNLSRYRAAAQALDNLGLADSRAVAALIGDDKFKAEFMGAQIPTDWLNKLLTQENWKILPKTAQDAVIGYIGARGAVIAYQKAVSGSGRANKEQLELELQNIPNPLLPKDVRERQFDRFQQNIDQTGAGLPKMVGIERPKEIKQRIETEEAQKQADAAKQTAQQGATHVYDPGSRRLIPADAQHTLTNRAGNAVIGYVDKNTKAVYFQ
jgi:hypothetical protein